MGDDDDEWGEGVQEAEGSRGMDACMRQVQSQVGGDVHIVGGERVAHCGMDEDGPAPDEDVRSDENEDEEEEMHRAVVKSKLNNASLSGKKVPAASPSKPSSSTAKPTTRKSSVKLVPVTFPSETPTKNNAKANELEPQLCPLSPAKSGPLISRL